jgi:flagellar secretion chaperone FliS
MSYTRQATRYRETEVLTATPGQLVVLLYDHLLLSLRRARTAMDARDAEAQSASLEKGRDVLTELLVTLDRDRGGEVASNLAALYSFLLGELVQVGIRADVARLDRVTGMISDLRDAFALASTSVVASAAQTA